MFTQLCCCCCRSATRLCPTLCDPVDCSTPAFPVLRHFLELAQTHVHWVGDAIKPSHLLSFSYCLQSFPASGSFPMSWLFLLGGQSIGVSALASVLPMNIQDWFPLGNMVWSPCSPRHSQQCSLAPQFNSINFSALSLLDGPSLTSIRDYWKNHTSYQNCSLLYHAHIQ